MMRESGQYGGSRSGALRVARTALCALGAALLLACDDSSSPPDDPEAPNAEDGGQPPDGGRGSKGFDSTLLGSPNRGRDAGGDAAEPAPPVDGGDPPSMPDASNPVVMDSGMPPPMAGSEAPPPEAPVIPADPGERGPWPVGVRTAMLQIGSGQVPVEIWYPATIGSAEGQTKVVYDFITWLPPEAQTALPATEKPVNVECNCYRDLPFDAEHGPYPVSIYVHNAGGFRTASVGLMTQWASRGFIVIAADHPREHLQDWVAYASLGVCTGSGNTADTNHTRDIGALLDSLRSPSGGFGFLSGAVDAMHVAVSGHVSGADFAAAASGQPGVRLIMIWDMPTAVTKRGDVEAIAYFANLDDRSSTTGYSRIESAFLDAPAPALLVGTRDTASQSMTELCSAKNAQGRDGYAISVRSRLCGIDWALLGAAWDCSDSLLNQADANHAFGLATTAALEEFLKGEDETDAWQEYRDTWGDVLLRL